MYRIELDLERHLGRVCQHFPDDTPSCGTKEPVCAVEGDIVLSGAPIDTPDGVAVRFTATFENGGRVAGEF